MGKSAAVLSWAVLAAVLCLPGCAALGEAAPVEVSDRAGLAALGENPTGSYRLTADVDLSGGDWTPIAFSGTLDGNGHTVYNMTVTAPDPVPVKIVDGNHKGYEAVFAGLFSRLDGAKIQDLTLLGARVDVTTEESCMAALLAGYADKTMLTNCRASGRADLTVSGKMCGVGGLVGYGSGDMTDCAAQATLVLTDTNPEEKSEAFLGGLLACGYTDIERCQVKLDGYASVTGYVHSGGLVGMHHIAKRELKHRGYVRYNAVDASITFFEDNDDRRAYCRPFVGEKQNEQVVVAKNEERRFVKNEATEYDRVLLPESCEKPEWILAVVPPTQTAFGYTLHTCKGCGYAYRDTYTPPVQ